MIEYYEYETSPRKIEPEYLPQHTKTDKKEIAQNMENKKKRRQEQLAQSKNNAKHIIEIAAGFVVLLTISYRYALINSSFTQKEKLKSTLAQIQKVNAQLQVNIEQGMNINTIEQAAQEKLGMQKLDNNQKVYVNLPKKDYVESSASRVIKNEEDESWWQKLLNTLQGK